MSLAGRGAVVTGGGRGIGAVVARSLGAAGARVVVAARSSDEIEAVAESVRQAGADAWAVRVDVAEHDSITALFEQARKHLGKVDILVNNAGIARAAPAVRLTLEDWNRMIAVNATGTFLSTQAVLADMIERGWGRIVNVASVAGLRGASYIAGYSASKHAVLGFTRSVAGEVARAGVTINAVCPGYVDTPMTEASIANIVAKTGKTTEEALGAILATTPQRRLITSEEVSAAVMFLCGDDARGINGQTIVLDGGAIGGLG